MLSQKSTFSVAYKRHRSEDVKKGHVCSCANRLDCIFQSLSSTVSYIYHNNLLLLRVATVGSLGREEGKKKKTSFVKICMLSCSMLEHKLKTQW